MGMCWYPECTHYMSPRQTCRFYSFPKFGSERKKWIRALRQAEPGYGAFICSCHFRDGKKENGPELVLSDTTNVYSDPAKGNRHASILPGDQMTDLIVPGPGRVMNNKSTESNSHLKEILKSKGLVLLDQSELARTKSENTTTQHTTSLPKPETDIGISQDCLTELNEQRHVLVIDYRKIGLSNECNDTNRFQIVRGNQKLFQFEKGQNFRCNDFDVALEDISDNCNSEQSSRIYVGNMKNARRCSVPLCPLRLGNTVGLKTFMFPTEFVRRQQWLYATGFIKYLHEILPDAFVKKLRICAAHFSEGDFSMAGIKKIVKKTAIPSFAPFTSSDTSAVTLSDTALPEFPKYPAETKSTVKAHVGKPGKRKRQDTLIVRKPSSCIDLRIQKLKDRVHIVEDAIVVWKLKQDLMALL